MFAAPVARFQFHSVNDRAGHENHALVTTIFYLERPVGQTLTHAPHPMHLGSP